MITIKSFDHPTFDHNQESWSSNIWSQPGVSIIQHLITTKSLDHPTFDHNQELDHPTFDHNQESWSSNIW